MPLSAAAPLRRVHFCFPRKRGRCLQAESLNRAGIPMGSALRMQTAQPGTRGTSARTHAEDGPRESLPGPRRPTVRTLGTQAGAECQWAPRARAAGTPLRGPLPVGVGGAAPAQQNTPWPWRPPKNPPPGRCQHSSARLGWRKDQPPARYGSLGFGNQHIPCLQRVTLIPASDACQFSERRRHSCDANSGP